MGEWDNDNEGLSIILPEILDEILRITKCDIFWFLSPSHFWIRKF